MGWIECNTDGVCRGDTVGASYIFCIRNGICDLKYAQADSIENVTNNIAEAQAILEALRYIIHLQFPQCLTEIDSMLMKRMLE